MVPNTSGVAVMGWGSWPMRKPEEPMNMREKMARAGYERAVKSSVFRFPNDGDILQMSLHSWENQSSALKEDWLAVVDAQLEALMEPTDGMIASGDDEMPLDPSCGGKFVFLAMIRAAKEGK
jgi:hypothetical protein